MNKHTREASVNVRILAFVIAVIFVGIALMVIWKLLPTPSTPPAPVTPPNATGTTPVPSPTSTPPVAPTSTGSVPSGMICGEGNNICVPRSALDMPAANPIIVTGTARVFENQFSWELVDGTSTVHQIASGHITAQDHGSEEPATFELRAFMLEMPTNATGTLRLYDNSARDGSVIDVLEIPIRFPSSHAVTTFKVFTLSILPGNTECIASEPVKASVPLTKLPIESAIRMLLDLNATGQVELNTAIPRGTELRSIVLNEGTLRLTFSPELDQNIGGSCRVSMIRSQIERTAKQFASVKSVVIIAEGKSPEETLQP